jgi:hypothetical protein
MALQAGARGDDAGDDDEAGARYSTRESCTGKYSGGARTGARWGAGKERERVSG